MFLQMMLVLMFLCQVTASGSGRHSLWVMASYISGNTQFPEFSAVAMLDDIQVAYYDSQTDQITRHSSAGQEEDLGLEAKFVMHDIFTNLRLKLGQAKQHFNLTEGGVQVQQRVTGCEVENGEPVLMMLRDGCNSEDADGFMYNMTHFTYTVRNSWEFWWYEKKRVKYEIIYPKLYLPICVHVIKLLLDREKNLVRRRVRPRVRLLSKQLVGAVRLTCLATDFYPRHINLTLLRDGWPVDERELTVGQVLPNGNGLYQVRKMLMIGNEELHNKHSYTCTASHLSLDNRLEVNWRAQFSRLHRIQVLSAPLAMMIIAIAVLLLLWCRRRSLRVSEGNRNTGETDNN